MQLPYYKKKKKLSTKPNVAAIYRTAKCHWLSRCHVKSSRETFVKRKHNYYSTFAERIAKTRKSRRRGSVVEASCIARRNTTGMQRACAAAREVARGIDSSREKSIPPERDRVEKDRRVKLSRASHPGHGGGTRATGRKIIGRLSSAVLYFVCG